MANSKNAKVKDLWVEGNWDFRFGWSFNDWELDSIQQFLLVVGQKTLNPMVSDNIRRSASSSGTFTVKSCFDLLAGNSSVQVPVETLWKSLLPTKVSSFAWEV